MPYSLTSKSLATLSKPERVRLNYLTLRSSKVDTRESMMRQDILHRQRGLDKIQLFLLRDAQGIIIAWSSVLPRPPKNGIQRAFVYTYVMRACRRQGLGTRLINRALQWCQKQSFSPQVFAWDTRSDDFFEKTAKDIEVVAV